MANVTMVTEFILMGFSEVRELQILYAVLFLLIYLGALLGNLLIISLTTFDDQLHTPMYFFLKHLSFLDLCYISVTVPKFISNTLANSHSISFLGCIMQVFLVVFLACTELALLTGMSYDRFVAICHPLHYVIIMKRRTCVKIAASSWLSGGLSGLLHTATSFSLPFCDSTKIHQFFCEIPQILRLSCSDDYSAEFGALAVTSSLSFVCFFFIAISYIHIFSKVLKIPSGEGRSKAFSTCVPHLIVVTIFLHSAAVAYLKPTSAYPSFVDLIVSIFYTILPPTLNPIIYSLRNKDIKAALRKLVRSL